MDGDGDDRLAARDAALTAYLGALQQEIHVLAGSPAMLRQQLVNRLQWEPAAHLDVRPELLVDPQGGTFLHVLSRFRESRALDRTMAGHLDWTTACAFTPDGTRLVSASSDHSLKVWSVEDGRELATLRGHTSRTCACAISPDGRLLASGSGDAELRIWDLDTYREIRVIRGVHGAEIWGCDFSPDSRILGSCSRDGKVVLWDVATGRIRTAVGQLWAGGAFGCAMSPDGQVLAVAFEDETVRLISVADGRERAQLVGSRGRVSRCAFAPDGTHLASVGVDRAVRLWDLRHEGRFIHDCTVLGEHSNTVGGCCFTPDGRLLVTASIDGTVGLWRLPGGGSGGILEGHGDAVYGCAADPTGSIVASVGFDKAVKLWEIGSVDARGVRAGHTDRVYTCAVALPVRDPHDEPTKLGVVVVSAGNDERLIVWDDRLGAPLSEMRERTGTIRACAASRWGWFVAAGHDGIGRVWELSTGRLRRTLQGHSDKIYDCAISPDGGRVATASEDRSARIWDGRDGKELRRLDHEAPVLACAFVGETALVTGCQDGSIRIWDSSTGSLLGWLAGHGKGVYRCRAGANGILATASWDGTVRVWDLAARSCVHVLTGHDDVVWDAAFVLDGKLLASVSDNGRLIVWETATGREVGRAQFSASLLSVAAHPCLPRVYCADSAGGVSAVDLISLPPLLPGDAANLRRSYVPPAPATLRVAAAPAAPAMLRGTATNTATNTATVTELERDEPDDDIPRWLTRPEHDEPDVDIPDWLKELRG